MSDALALLEVASLARGVVVADAVAKRASIELIQCEPVSPGKYLILFAGGVAEVEESQAAGAAAAGEALVDRLFLPQAHEQLLPAIRAGAKGFAHEMAEETWQLRGSGMGGRDLMFCAACGRARSWRGPLGGARTCEEPFDLMGFLGLKIES